MKIGDVGVIQKSKHPWNNGKKVTITDNGRFETGYNRKGNPIQIKVFTAADDQGNLFLLGESNFKPSI